MFCGCEAAWGRGEVPPGNGSASFSLDLRRWGRSQGGSCVAECRDLCRAVVREQLHEVSQRFLCLKHRVGTLLTWSSWEWVFSSFLISPKIYRLVPIDASNAPSSNGTSEYGISCTMHQNDTYARTYGKGIVKAYTDIDV
ncbi:hypothetical protein Y1Q_0002740 [Alligator mississippiensis]|uniref:Uncharacterized protein n=1 Tax=Alligator mississippiensis TaxID=8496 RepID=A0A151NZ80_ALLMI|nr:hypothetical protein Y1Q_0002740 [Alligator mississippiensis]